MTHLKYHGQRIKNMSNQELLNIRYKISNSKCNNDTIIQGIPKHKWLKSIDSILNKHNTIADKVFSLFPNSKIANQCLTKNLLNGIQNQKG